LMPRRKCCRACHVLENWNWPSLSPSEWADRWEQAPEPGNTLVCHYLQSLHSDGTGPRCPEIWRVAGRSPSGLSPSPCRPWPERRRVSTSAGPSSDAWGRSGGRRERDRVHRLGRRIRLGQPGARVHRLSRRAWKQAAEEFARCGPARDHETGSRGIIRLWLARRRDRDGYAKACSSHLSN